MNYGKINTRSAIGETFRFSLPAGAEEDVFVRLSELAIHRHVDDGIDAGRKVDQNVADNMGICKCRESNKRRCSKSGW